MTFELGLHIGMLGPPIGRSQGPISILVLGFFVGQIWAWPKNGPFLTASSVAIAVLGVAVIGLGILSKQLYNDSIML